MGRPGPVRTCRSGTAATTTEISRRPASTGCGSRTAIEFLAAGSCGSGLRPRSGGLRHRLAREPTLQRGQLLAQSLRELGSEALVVLLDERQLPLPAFDVHPQQLGDLLLG